eukprot:TRINITY_DN15451_c0_g1_i2.p1 TRINITY_DN15451_c0_g1~~TRINITY_DN15451_c0_g1_i2.p1  ORF type:complete len:671 (+),score=111.42 TRINITY_DN15451_c0_g1_i2:95-2014(+)
MLAPASAVYGGYGSRGAVADCVWQRLRALQGQLREHERRACRAEAALVKEVAARRRAERALAAARQKCSTLQCKVSASLRVAARDGHAARATLPPVPAPPLSPRVRAAALPLPDSPRSALDGGNAVAEAPRVPAPPESPRGRAAALPLPDSPRTHRDEDFGPQARGTPDLATHSHSQCRAPQPLDSPRTRASQLPLESPRTRGSQLPLPLESRAALCGSQAPPVRDARCSNAVEQTPPRSNPLGGRSSALSTPQGSGLEQSPTEPTVPCSAHGPPAFALGCDDATELEASPRAMSRAAPPPVLALSTESGGAPAEAAATAADSAGDSGADKAPVTDDGDSGRELFLDGAVVRYRQDAVLGKGGGGSVWQGTIGEVPCAVKCIQPKRDLHRQEALQALTEARRMKHDNFIPTLAAGLADGMLWHVMPLATQHICPLCGTMNLKDAYRFAAMVADSVAFLHERGWVHRDLKPSNYLMVDGVPKLADVDSMVRQGTQSEWPPFTWLYVAPEVAEHLGAPGHILTEDCPRDTWALGIVAHEVILGRPPAPFHPNTRDCVLNLRAGQLLWDKCAAKWPDQDLQERADMCYYGLVATVRLRPKPDSAEVTRPVKSLLDKCFRRSPRDRCSASVVRDGFLALWHAA